jgi:hypothetical protein
MNNLKTAHDVLLEAGYAHGVIDAGMAYADELGWKDEDDRGSLALARILYDDAELELSPPGALGVHMLRRHGGLNCVRPRADHAINTLPRRVFLCRERRPSTLSGH